MYVLKEHKLWFISRPLKVHFLRKLTKKNFGFTLTDRLLPFPDLLGSLVESDRLPLDVL